MLTSVSVVVILGAIIAAIAWAVLTDEGQPATADPQAGTGPTDAGPPDSDQTAEAEDTILVPEADVRVASRPRGSGVAPASWWQRARAVVLLALTIAALGAMAAVALGLLVLGGAALFDQALG